jgi:hypothetical protein
MIERSDNAVDEVDKVAENLNEMKIEKEEYLSNTEQYEPFVFEDLFN